MRLTGCNARRARPNRHNNIAAHYKKRLLPRSLIRLNNLMKHGSFVGAKLAFTRVHAIASSGSSCDNYENFSSYQEKSAGALTFSG